MTARDWAFLGCRMIALAYGFGALVQLGVALPMYLGPDNPAAQDMKTLWEGVMNNLPLYMIFVKLAGSAALFYAAGWISGLLIRTPAEPAKPLPPRTIMAVGTWLAAVFIGLQYLPDLVSRTADYIQEGSLAQQGDLSHLLATAIGLALLGLVAYWAWRSATSTGTREIEEEDVGPV